MKLCRIVCILLLLITTTFSNVIIGENCKNNQHIKYGIPKDPNVLVDQIICKENMAIGYNFENKIPMWVAFNASSKNLNHDTNRTKSFTLEREIINKSYRSKTSDYTKSNYDRGHMASASTAGYTKELMKNTFKMSNITPQKPNFNRGIWYELENFERKMIKSKGELYIVMGVVFYNEKPKRYIRNKKDNARVRIPDAFYKVLYDNEKQEVNAFILEHSDSEKKNYEKGLTSINIIESASGFDIIPHIKDDIEDIIEDKVSKIWK